MTHPDPDRKETMPVAAPEQIARKPAYEIEQDGEDVVIRIPRYVLSRDHLSRFLDWIELEQLKSGNQLTEEDVAELTREVKHAVWRANRHRAGVRTESSMRDKALELMEQLPSDASVEEMMDQLELLSKVERGLRQIEAGQVVSHEDAKRRFGR